ncbi:MAG: hypothetical protein RL190_1970 [Actinomycetota bacterium]
MNAIPATLLGRLALGLGLASLPPAVLAAAAPTGAIALIVAAGAGAVAILAIVIQEERARVVYALLALPVMLALLLALVGA